MRIRSWRSAVAVAPIWCAGACTIINVGDGHRATMIRPGVVQIAPAPGASLLTYRSRGLGLVPGRSGPTLGWAREDTVLLYDPSECRVVVIDPPAATDAAAFWAKLVEDHPDICLVGRKR